MKVTRRDALKMAAVFAAGGAGSSSAGVFGSESNVRNLAVKADSGPLRSESGVGALMAWADRLWAVTYLSEPKHGSGTGLYEIAGDFTIRKRHESNGVYANRLLHKESNQINIGPYMIDSNGKVRVIEKLLGERLTATMTHLKDPSNKLYILTMEGLFHELDVHTLKTTRLFDLTKELSIKGDPHFKGGYTGRSRVVVANNTFTGPGDTDGRLAEWDGKRWTILERKPFMEVASRSGFGSVIFATGWDESSAILKAFVGGKWLTYRLPKASHTFDHYWQTEWTRIREVETERYLMDCHGMFYELSPVAFHNAIWGVRPICTHLRIVPDFCSFRGFFVMAGNEAAAAGGNLLSPQPQSGIWFGHTDDLWRFGKPQGWGGPWRDSLVKAGEASDPFLMTGFDKKVLHLYQEGAASTDFIIEVDFLGHGFWQKYATVRVASGEYKYHVFPTGFSAHWVRIKPIQDCKATAEFIYT